MRTLSLLVLSAGLLAGCSALGLDRYDRPQRGSARVDHRDGDRYRVCHDGRRTLTLSARAARDHVRHGDELGACRRADRQADRRDDRRRYERRDRRRHDRRYDERRRDRDDDDDDDDDDDGDDD